MAKRINAQRGMTLLEVMVALAIFSTAAIALMNAVSLNVRYTHGLGETLQASWVAENQLALALLEKRDFPDAALEGEEDMGGRTWRWRAQRVDVAKVGAVNQIAVFAQGDDRQPVVSLRVMPPEAMP